MGYNSTIVVLNDSLETIEKHPEEFVQKMRRGIQEMSLPKHHRRKDESVGNHSNPFSVIACKHADATQLVAVGGNYGTLIGAFHNGGHHETDEHILGLLKRAAETLGYELHKIPESRQRQQ